MNSLMPHFFLRTGLRLLVPLAFSIVVSCSPEKPAEYPSETWRVAATPEEVGFSSEQLAVAKSYSESIHTSAMVIVRQGVIASEWGEPERKFMTHSIRKSVLAILYGIYAEKGMISLDATMGELGVDDEPPLSPLERQATVRDLLKSRSGIYHDALYESQRMKDLKPIGLVVQPGTFWYYNNWDFNAAGTIFEKLTGKGIFDAIKEDVAVPIGMEHFEASDGWYVTGEESVHAAYPFHISARDLARFGLLMLREGRWKDQQVVPAHWVRESTRYHSDATLYQADGYGYMWWVARDFNRYPHLPNVCLPEGSYSARGAGGHYLLVIPDYDLIMVHRVDTYIRENRVSAEEFGILANLVLKALL